MRVYDSFLVLSTFHLKIVTKLDLEDAEFFYLLYFGLKPPRDNVATVLNCADSRWAVDYQFQHSFR